METGRLDAGDMIRIRELMTEEPARELSDRQATAIATVFDELAYRRSRTTSPMRRAA